MVGDVNPDLNIDEVHREVFATVITEHGLLGFTEEDREAIHRTWHELEAWPDVASALARLRSKYAVVSFTILSTSLVLDVSRRNDLTLDCIGSCEVIGTYKPQPRGCPTWARGPRYPPDR